MKNKGGRPRSVSKDGDAPAVAVRLPLDVLEQVEKWAAAKGMSRSDAIRDMVTYAVASKMIDDAKAAKRKK